MMPLDLTAILIPLPHFHSEQLTFPGLVGTRTLERGVVMQA